MGLDDEVHRPAELYAALVDRLTFGGNIIAAGTVSYRLAHPPHSVPAPAPPRAVTLLRNASGGLPGPADC